MMSIPSELLSLLRQARYDPTASRRYDLFSGGFLWSDEFPEGVWEVAIRLQDWSHRMLISH